MLSEKMVKAVNDQIELEFSSAYLYLAMAADCEAQNLPGFAKWFKIQFQEEQSHGLKLFDYVVERSGRVTLGPVAKPKAEFGSPLDAFKQVLAHERKVTAAIHKLYELAMAEKDYATTVLLQWFIKEQVEEEKTAEDIILQIEAIGDKKYLLFMIDHKMGERKIG